MKTSQKSRLVSGKLLAVAVGCLAFQSVQAELLFSDGFNYTLSDDLGYGSTTPPWTAGATGTADLSIGSGNLTYSGLENLGGYDLIVNSGGGTGSPAYASFGNATSGNIYYSFLLDCTLLPTGNSYLTSLTTSGGPNGGNDTVSLYSYQSGSGYQLAVRSTGAGGVKASTVWLPTRLI